MTVWAAGLAASYRTRSASDGPDREAVARLVAHSLALGVLKEPPRLSRTRLTPPNREKLDANIKGGNISGFGKLPAGTKGIRMRVWGSTWPSAAKPVKHDTEVAIDNAHFAVLGSPNMLLNGNFEMGVREGELKGWTQPAAWPFPRSGMKPRDIINAYGENFDHGTYRPFYGARWSYGYTTYLDGWTKDAFTFSQSVKYDLPPGTPLTLMFNWVQNIADGAKANQLRVVGTHVETVVEYLKGNERLGAEGLRADWPVPKGPAAVGRYDQNADTAYNPRFYLQPPKGTDRIGLHVNFFVNMPYRDGFVHISSAIDDFWLGPADKPQP